MGGLWGHLLREIFETEKDKHCTISFMWNKKQNQIKQKTEFSDNREYIGGCQRCEAGVGDEIGEAGEKVQTSI